MGSALLVIDMQNAFCHPQGTAARLGRPLVDIEKTIEMNVQAVRAARASGVPIVLTRHLYRAGYVDVGRVMAPLVPSISEVNGLLAGTWDAEIIDELTPTATDHVVDKARFDAFLWSPLSALLAGLGVDSLWVTGVLTTMCVESTVRSAAMRDFSVSVIEGGCTDLDARAHAGSLDVLTSRGFISAAGVGDIGAPLGVGDKKAVGAGR